MRRFHIKEIQAGQSEILLSGSEGKHLKNVLRLKTGTLIRVFDGRGNEYTGRISDMTEDGVRVQLADTSESPLENSCESPVHITIAQAFLKEKKMDELLPRLTELGIRRWIPFFAQRSVARPDEKRIKARKERWEKIVRESLKQCRRTRVPEIGDLLSFPEMLELGRDSDLRLIFWEELSDPESGESAATFVFGEKAGAQNIFAVIGPEGGFCPEEIRLAREAGFLTAGLGPRILKAETATLAACTLLQHYYGDMG